MSTTLLAAGLPIHDLQRLGSRSAEEESLEALGDLAGLIGTWTGDRGKNLIAVPKARSNPDDPGHFELLQHDYEEELTIRLVGLARNRGGDLDQFVAALRYDQVVRVKGDKSSDADKTTIHVENGMFLALRRVETEPMPGQPAKEGLAPLPFARSATIPHGNTVLVYGESTIVEALPDISPILFKPTDFGEMSGYAEVEYKDVPKLEDLLKADFPADHGKPETTTFFFDSTRGTSQLASVPYLQVRANARRFRSTFWLIKGDKNNVRRDNLRLQYSQTIDLEFQHKFIGPHLRGTMGQITWPHVTINSLMKKELLT
jgi:hypothetical protein